MHFTRLRLTGFKSFVEPTELLVEPGTTGIVGPNGCGKSNLVEALRWVMGETSPKRMRGGGMDDVIFAGTSLRPARNLAEVSLLLDNADRTAPAAFNDSDEIEVARRIEREEGSAYSVNSIDVRARDVQLLFADMVTGAHSSALVSQGEIGALIQAKPVERRVLLEEAAGITGLHSRRHEAELRLRTAEVNLERLADIAVTLEDQQKGLKRQARQASRYANLSGHIRAAQALLLLRLWNDAVAEEERAAAALREAERAAGVAAETAARASSGQGEAAAKVPPLRADEVAKAARLQRLTMECENLDAEEARAQGEVARIGARTAETDSDIEREEALGSDATRRMADLAGEAGELEAAPAGEAAALAEAEAVEGRAAAALAEAEADSERAREALHDAETRRAGLATEADGWEARLAEIDTRAGEIAAECDRLGGARAPARGAEQAVPEIAAARARAAAAAEALAATETARAARAERLAAAREALSDAEGRHTGAAAELSALEEVLAADEDEPWPPILDAVTVEPGYEAAVAAALGDDLAVSADTVAPAHWAKVSRTDAPALPEECVPLSRYVQAPEAVALRLSQIGVVDTEHGAGLRRQLAQGQRLVSREGALWRWDGFTTAPGARTGSAARLRQRNRLPDLRSRMAGLEQAAAAARAAFEAASAAAADADAREAAARAASREADGDLSGARESHASALQEAVAKAERFAALVEAGDALKSECEGIAARLARAREALAELPVPEDLRAVLEGARTEAGTARGIHREAERVHLRAAEQAAGRTRRLETIATERESWQARAAEAEAQIERLGARRTAHEAELAAWRQKPAEIPERRQELMTRTGQAEAERREAADRLADAENVLKEHDREARAAAEAAAEAREQRVRMEARALGAAERKQEVAVRFETQLECKPREAREVAGLKPDAELPDAEQVEARLERLRRERENMGPVNLRAEIEAREIEEQLARMAAEREDLEGAIRKLRTGIGNLNREGRQRLLNACEAVNGHFADLFTTLFGGGEARVELVESDDPLEAGLEILASPPGKRLQALSLLSGGEQALTALALHFAVFLTNPAPVCVLDEVDAPLDDANVARFCSLVEELARGGGTRFLVITHHPLTMARMDRLFGVTMAERGVSQLVSVDLARAEAMREAS